MTPDHHDQTELVDSSLLLRQPEPIQAFHTATLAICERLPYEQAWCLQRACQAERAADRCRDLLLLMEHSPVFTAGRTTQNRHWPGEEQLTQRTGLPVIRTDRGGSITYHGPGQVVGYPILRLSDYCAGPKAYVHRLESVLIATLAEWGITGHRIARLPGVWVGGSRPSKIAFIGVRISQGITTHGFAFNVSMNLTPFSQIVPCGIADCRVTSMAALLGTAPAVYVVTQRIAAIFAEHFQLTWAETISLERLASCLPSPTVSLMTGHVNTSSSHEE
jgi:lipoyl(octanoyl) transferase